MIFSSLLQRKTRYEATSVEHIWIEPIVLAPSSSSNSVLDEEEDHFDFDSKRIMNNGHGVYWIEENYNSDDDNLCTLPGAVDDFMEEEESWEESFDNPKGTSLEPVFNLLPNGRRKKSLRKKVRDMLFRRSSYRRAAYAIDSRTTSLADVIAESSEKICRFIKNVTERLRPTENSWTNLENLFAEANNHFVPFYNMNHFAGL